MVGAPNQIKTADPENLKTITEAEPMVQTFSVPLNGTNLLISGGLLSCTGNS